MNQQGNVVFADVESRRLILSLTMARTTYKRMGTIKNPIGLESFNMAYIPSSSFSFVLTCLFCSV